MTPFFDPHQLYLIYNPTGSLDRKVHALAFSVDKFVHEIDVRDNTITPLLWKEILGMLHINPIDVINKDHADYHNLISGRDFSEDDYLEVLFKNPQLVKGPIGIFEGKAVLCDDQNDIYNLGATPDAEQRGG